MKRFLKKSSGFTLIELLIVIAILAILATVVFVNLNPGGNLIDTRNARRVSDVSTLETAIQKYSLDNPTIGAPATAAALVPNYLGALPTDPSTNTAYSYCRGTTNLTSYAILATLETNGTAAKLASIMATSSVAANMPAGCTVAPYNTCTNIATGLIFCHSNGA